jgi:imidazolonepropionase-like amidohydrolase
MNKFLRTLALIFGFAAFAVPAGAAKLALVGGTIHPVTGAVIERGVIVIDGEKIVAVGAGVTAPSDATVIDCTGKHVYPGLVSANTQLGLMEISTIEGANDTQETGAVNPNIRAEVMLNPDSDFLPVARIQGVTSALIVPGGGTIHGTSALMHLDGWTHEDMTVRAPVGLHVDWPSMGPRRGFFVRTTDDDQNKARDEAIQAIRDAFETAKAYEKAKGAEGQPGVPKHDQDTKWDAMRAVVRGEVPVFFHAGTLAQLHAVIRFIDEQGLKHCVIVGGTDALLVAEDLKSRDIAVIVAGTLNMPPRRSDAYDEGFTLPARLAAAGVRYCIADQGGGFNAAFARNLGHQASMAAAFGLPRDEALKAVTLYPAQILGAGDKLGSIEVGKYADLQITDGDPLELSSHVTQVILDGKAISMESRQTRLFHKYDSKPRGAKARAR